MSRSPSTGGSGPAAETVGPPETFHGFAGGATERIDYVLVAPEIAVSRTGTVATEPPHPSDHYPVFADIELPDAD